MQNIISLTVVMIFFAIVFRKRLAPLFRGRKTPEKDQTVEVVKPDQDLQKEYYNVVVFDLAKHPNEDISSGVMTVELEREFDFIRKKGYVSGLDVVSAGHHVVFLIKWQMSAVERK